MTRLTAGVPLTPLRTGVITILHAPAFLRRILQVAARFFVLWFVVTLHVPRTFVAARAAKRVVFGVALIVYVVPGAAANVAINGSSVAIVVADSATAFSGAGGSAMLTAVDGVPPPTRLMARSLIL